MNLRNSIALNMIRVVFFSLIFQLLAFTLSFADSPYAPEKVGTALNDSVIGAYSYDTAGNRLLNSTNVQTIEYGLIGKAVKISQGSFTSLIYHGPGGRRYLKANSDGSKTLYLNGMDYKIDGNTVTTSIRINAKGYSPAAQVDIDSSGTNTYTYFVQDHLGSPVVSVNTSGTVNKRNRYDAWGQMTEATGVANIPNTTAEIKDAEKNRGYTGHELMAKFNLGQWNGRVFDYEIGAFPQADNFIQGRSTAALNPYALGQNNNPNVTDPSGWMFRFNPEQLITIRDAAFARQVRLTTERSERMRLEISATKIQRLVRRHQSATNLELFARYTNQFLNETRLGANQRTLGNDLLSIYHNNTGEALAAITNHGLIHVLTEYGLIREIDGEIYRVVKEKRGVRTIKHYYNSRGEIVEDPATVTRTLAPRTNVTGTSTRETIARLTARANSLREEIAILQANIANSRRGFLGARNRRKVQAKINQLEGDFQNLQSSINGLQGSL